MSNVEDRRKFPRIPLLSEVWIKESADGPKTHASTEDLSKGGLRATLKDSQFDVGQQVFLELRVPGSTVIIPARGTIVWQSKTEVGVSFVELPKESAAAVEIALDKALEELKSFENEKTPTAATT